MEYLHDWRKDESKVLASYPPRYEWKCSKCGEVRSMPCEDGEPDPTGCKCADGESMAMIVTPKFVDEHDAISIYGKTYYSEKKFDELRVEVESLKLELKQVTGAMKNALNNQAQAKVSNERERQRLAELRASLLRDPNERLVNRVKQLEDEVSELRGKLVSMRDETREFWGKVRNL